MPGLAPTDHHDVRFLHGPEAIEHLFRVACGLDSLVIGEHQVLGQVRRALVLAQEASAAGPVLSNIFGRALRLGRDVRAQTSLGRLGASIGTVAADYLEARFQGLSGRRAVIVGAGEAAADAAKAIWKAGAQLTIVSRTTESAENLAALVDATFRPMDQLEQALQDSDFALVAVLGGTLIQGSQLPKRSGENPYLVLDLSLPRAIETSARDDVEVRNLEEIPGPRGPEITEAVIDAEALVKKEVADLLHWADTRAAGPTIRELQKFAEDLVRDEVRRAAPGLQLDTEQIARIEALAMRVANKLLHGPAMELRRADHETLAAIRRIFHLGE
jgi:glutamyl-tRNA reductase